MKVVRRLLPALLLAAAACGSTIPAPTKPAGPAQTGTLLPAEKVQTDHGDPIALGTTATFDPATGTTLRANDGGVALFVPAGAVTTATALSVTPVSNFARGGLGQAYRLGPEGTTFEAPVTLTFRAPSSLPAGTSFAGIAVMYQDASGFWRRVTPVTRDAARGTLSVQTTHFSDWALTWSGGTAVAEGPITLIQSLAQTFDLAPWNSPFAATGQATIYFLGDDAYDTSYGLTGWVTLADSTVTVDGHACTADQPTQTLPMNVAEVHKSTPPVFRWGLGVSWALTCDDGPRVMPALFDTMGINPPSCPGDYTAQSVSGTELSGAYTKDCGTGGLVTATWSLSCAASQVCTSGDCTLGLTVCSGGVQSCVGSDPAPDGTPCSLGTCSGGICLP
jgi:hypothetical protein